MPQSRLLAEYPLQAARLLTTANELSFARDVATVTAMVRTTAREVTGADGITIVLRDGSYCHYVDEDAIAPLWKGRRFPLEACISGWVMLHGESVVVPDIYQDGRVPTEAYRQTFVKSLAMVPVGGAQAIAAIGAYWATPHTATAMETETLEVLADSTALALANVRLHDEARAALAREHEARAASERAVAAKNEFLAIVAHELRQPLHACVAAARLLRVHDPRPAGPARAGVILERQLQHLARMVDDLSLAAQVVAGSVTLHREPVDLRVLLTEATDSLQFLAVERSHSVDLQLCDAPVTAVVDRARVHQIVTNLVTNAIKYTPPGGHIQVTLRDQPDAAIIEVRDNGRGIPPDVLPRIFELFTRAADDASGFGIGLAVVRRLVELHGGTVAVRANPDGVGTAFSVRLPLRESTPG